MATTPEEFFDMGLKEQPPPSPPVFPQDLPQGPNGSSKGQHHVSNEVMLSYASHVLMDDEIGDEFNDHPALLQVQQPFAQILSSPSSGSNTGRREGSNEFLHEDNNVDESMALPKGPDAVEAFSKGMEEANMLFPEDNNFRKDELVNYRVRESGSQTGVKKRHSRDDHLQMEITRISKAMMMIKELEENDSANETLDEMMLHDYKACIRGMDNLRITMDSELENKKLNSCSSKGMRVNVVDIRRLMIFCAQEVAANNHLRARELLKQIMQHASETGDATQRLAQCFSKGLEARLLGTGSLHWKLLLAERPSVTEFIKASSLYFEACCFNRVALAFSEMTIVQAMVGKTSLHIVDYGMQFGYQWVSLLRSLASRDGAPPEVKITAIGLPKAKSNPTEKIEEIGCWLSTTAYEFGLPSFKFHTIKTNWEDARIEDLNLEADEVLVVNDLFCFSTLMDESISVDDQSPRDIVLNNISKMRLHVFIQSLHNCSYGSSFLSRFREMLFYYMALFDIFDATIPRDSKSRMVLEQVVLGRSALNALSCEGADLVERPESWPEAVATED